MDHFSVSYLEGATTSNRNVPQLLPPTNHIIPATSSEAFLERVDMPNFYPIGTNVVGVTLWVYK